MAEVGTGRLSMHHLPGSPISHPCTGIGLGIDKSSALLTSQKPGHLVQSDVKTCVGPPGCKLGSFTRQQSAFGKPAVQQRDNGGHSDTEHRKTGGVTFTAPTQRSKEGGPQTSAQVSLDTWPGPRPLFCLNSPPRNHMKMYLVPLINTIFCCQKYFSLSKKFYFDFVFFGF